MIKRRKMNENNKEEVKHRKKKRLNTLSGNRVKPKPSFRQVEKEWLHTKDGSRIMVDG